MKPEDALPYLVVRLGWSEVAVGVIILASLQFIIGLWIKARLESSIKHHYDLLLKDYEAHLKNRERATGVAELLAVAFDPKTEPARFNKLAWELSLWLPAPLLCEISRCLVSDPGARTPKEILIQVRKILLQDKNDSLIAENILHREDPGARGGLTAALTKESIARSLAS